MPTVNIPPRVRFILYVVGALASLGVAYAVNKAWAGDAEVQLISGIVALINVLAAAKTNLSSDVEDVRDRHEADPPGRFDVR